MFDILASSSHRLQISFVSTATCLDEYFHLSFDIHHLLRRTFKLYDSSSMHAYGMYSTSACMCTGTHAQMDSRPTFAHAAACHVDSMTSHVYNLRYIYTLLLNFF